jgi:hypothetical protein
MEQREGYPNAAYGKDIITGPPKAECDVGKRVIVSLGLSVSG